MRIMKKYFILAVAALAASAACTKVETEFNVSDPGNKIAFEVANYAAQTKAPTNVALTNAEDGIFQFHTVANQFPAIGNPVQFMDVDILPWNGTTQVTSANISSNNITAWAPAEDYFWPKTGYINFYSYAGTAAPTVDNSASDKKTVKFAYNDVTIDANSNILVADPALHYARTNSATETYQVDNSETSGHITKGVPTLFHHQLAKIIVDVEARTTDAKKSANTIWKVQVLKDYDATHVSTISPINKGSLALTSADASTSAETVAWTKDNANATNISGWVPGTDKEVIKLEQSEVLTIDVNQTSSGTPDEILAARSVMPQLTNGVDFKLTYRVQALHGSTVFMEEIRTVGIDAAAVIGSLANTVPSWEANKKITYHIIIDPVSEKVTFDPAVEEYDALDADGTVDEININENGLVTP